jgi:hypothetical protein
MFTFRFDNLAKAVSLSMQKDISDTIPYIESPNGRFVVSRRGCQPVLT